MNTTAKNTDTPKADEHRDAFEAWAGVQYRNAENYTARDYLLGLSAWRACMATGRDGIIEEVARMIDATAIDAQGAWVADITPREVCEVLAEDVRDMKADRTAEVRAKEGPSAKDEALQRMESMLANRLTPFGLTLRALRCTAGTTLYAMAKAVGISTATLSGMETRRKELDPSIIPAVVAHLMACGMPDVTDVLVHASKVKP